MAFGQIPQRNTHTHTQSTRHGACQPRGTLASPVRGGALPRWRSPAKETTRSARRRRTGAAATTRRWRTSPVAVTARILTPWPRGSSKIPDPRALERGGAVDKGLRQGRRGDKVPRCRNESCATALSLLFGEEDVMASWGKESDW
jgi:hypothetical protein